MPAPRRVPTATPPDASLAEPGTALEATRFHPTVRPRRPSGDEPSASAKTCRCSCRSTMSAAQRGRTDSSAACQAFELQVSTAHQPCRCHVQSPSAAEAGTPASARGGSGSAQVPLTQRGRRLRCPPTSRRRLRGARRGGTLGAKRAPPCERRGSSNSGTPRTAGDPGNTSTKYPVVPPREVKTKPGSDPANTAEATCWRPPGQGGASERSVVTEAVTSRRGQRAAFSAERQLPS